MAHQPPLLLAMTAAPMARLSKKTSNVVSRTGRGA